MTRNISRETAQNSLDKKLDVPKIFYGWLGNNDDVVDVPGRINYVYVKMTDGMVTQAYNVVVPSILNLPVICGYDQNQLSSGLLKVLSVRNVPRQTPNSTPPGSTLVSHHKSHEWMNGDGGQDVTYIELRQYMPLRPSIIEPFTVRIERGILNLNGAWKYLPSQTVDLSGYVPEAPVSGLSGSGVMGRYSLVSLEAVSGSPAVTSGSLVPITEISLSNVPTTPVGNYPICAVFTYYYQEKIVEARTRTDLIDLRSWAVTSGTSGSTGSVSGSHNDLYGLQGGSTNERYHLTAAQYTIATQASGSGQAGYLTASDWNKFNTASGSQVVPNSHAPVANFYLTGYDKTSGSFSSGSVLSGTSGSGAWYLRELLDVQAPSPVNGDGLYFYDDYWRSDARRLSYVIDNDSYDEEWTFSGSVTHSGADLIFNGTPNGLANSIFRKLLPNIRYKVQTIVGGLSGGTIRVGAGAQYPTFPINEDGEYIAYFTLDSEDGYITVNVASGSPTATLTGLSYTPCYLSEEGGVIPVSHSPVSQYYLTGYDSVSGSFSSGSVAGGGTSGSGGIPEAPIDGKTYGRKDAGWTEIVSGSGGSSGSGASTFLELTDTPSSYSGQAGKVVTVNSGGTGLEFVSLEVLLAIGFFLVDTYVSDGDSPV